MILVLLETMILNRCSSLRFWHSIDKTFTVYFKDCVNSFEFRQAPLSASFDFFRNLLKPGVIWSEHRVGQVTLTNVYYYHFGVLVTWLQSGLLTMPHDPATAIATWRFTISTADYLQMVNVEKYVETIKMFMTKTLRKTRTAFDSRHLAFMQQEDLIFRTKGKSITTVVTQAAVRPLMTCHLKNRGDNWAVSIRHYEKLVAGNES